jgi:hypothetical protein
LKPNTAECEAYRAQMAGINLNPYQGLKLKSPGGFKRMVQAGINLNPYQGLKLEVQAGINLNPYQGLKRTCNPF